jgi:hypothetical protein
MRCAHDGLSARKARVRGESVGDQAHCDIRGAIANRKDRAREHVFLD